MKKIHLVILMASLATNLHASQGVGKQFMSFAKQPGQNKQKKFGSKTNNVRNAKDKQWKLILEGKTINIHGNI